MNRWGLIALVVGALAAPVSASTVDPIQTIQTRLKRIDCEAPVTYQTNAAEVYCTIHCRDDAERLTR
jgi:hypothetical protein